MQHGQRHRSRANPARCMRQSRHHGAESDHWEQGSPQPSATGRRRGSIRSAQPTKPAKSRRGTTAAATAEAAAVAAEAAVVAEETRRGVPLHLLVAVVIKEAEAALGVPRPSRTTPNGGVRRHGEAKRKPATRRASTEQPASVYAATGKRRRRLLPTGTRRSSGTDSEPQGNTRLAERQSGSDARGGSGSDCIGKCITRTSIFARGLYWRLEVRTESLEGRWRYIECVASVRDFISSRGRPSARTTFRISLAMATGGGSVCSATDAGATRLRDVHTAPGVWRRGGSTGPIHSDGIARRHPRNRNAGGQDQMSPA